MSDTFVKIERPETIDLTTCDREPIHVPGSVQPHGVLLGLRESDLTVVLASRNVDEFLGRPLAAVLGRPLDRTLAKARETELRAALARLPASGEPVLLGSLEHDGRELSAVLHRADGLVVLEIEPATTEPTEARPDLHPTVASFIVKVQGVPEIGTLGTLVAQEVRRVTGFDRVLVYRFDEDGTGIVVAEDRNERFPSLQDHRFPASDIPRQARELYRRNRLRIIPDADYVPAPLVPAANPETGRPLDLSQSTLRSVSPVHVEYMRNMGTAASMSISVILDGELWGLISCHNAAPRTVPFEARTACDLLAQVFALQIGARTHAAAVERRAELNAALTKLLAHMAEADDFASGLVGHGDDLLAFAHASGAAIIAGDRCELVGETPAEGDVRALADWLFRYRGQDLFATSHLTEEFPEAEAYAERASGLLAISVSQVNPALVLWFRPETVSTIRWGGDPRKAEEPGSEGGRINPRKSFETWRETVRRQATPWLASEIEAAGSLRSAILGIVLRQAEELAAVSTELRRTNEDLERANKELEAFSYSVSHDLRAPLRHIVGYAEILKERSAERLETREIRYVDTIIDSCQYAGKLVDNLLDFSRMARTSLTPMRVDMNVVFAEVRRSVADEAAGRRVEWTVDPLPTVSGDVMMLRLAVQNLLSNALKYTRSREIAKVHVKAERNGPFWVFSVADNGVGFDMRYLDKLFGVFQRLHRWEDYEGTGIGLANVRRIVERHGGHVWAEGVVDRGATFYFSLPAGAGGAMEMKDA